MQSEVKLWVVSNFLGKSFAQKLYKSDKNHTSYTNIKIKHRIFRSLTLISIKQCPFLFFLLFLHVSSFGHKFHQLPFTINRSSLQPLLMLRPPIWSVHQDTSVKYQGNYLWCSSDLSTSTVVVSKFRLSCHYTITTICFWHSFHQTVL